MPHRGADLAGRVLSRTYRVERLLGRGGVGLVYVVEHIRTGGLFAVKVLHGEAAADPDIFRRFQMEALTVSALRHPHIVQVTDFDMDEDGSPFMVMELLEGETLHQRLRREGRLPLPKVLVLARQVGSALHAAHEKGVVHRDIKPQNIFLTTHEHPDGVAEVAKVVDFGISKIRQAESQITQDLALLGTPHYMSPESALGQNPSLDGRADQWALAVILYRALSGQLPFDGDDLMGVLYQVVHGTPVPLAHLVPGLPGHVTLGLMRALSKNKEERFPTTGEFVRALIGLGPPLAQASSAVTPVTPPWGADVGRPGSLGEAASSPAWSATTPLPALPGGDPARSAATLPPPPPPVLPGPGESPARSATTISPPPPPAIPRGEPSGAFDRANAQTRVLGVISVPHQAVPPDPGPGEPRPLSTTARLPMLGRRPLAVVAWAGAAALLVSLLLALALLLSGGGPDGGARKAPGGRESSDPTSR